MAETLQFPCEDVVFGDVWFLRRWVASSSTNVNKGFPPVRDSPPCLGTCECLKLLWVRRGSVSSFQERLRDLIGPCSGTYGMGYGLFNLSSCGGRSTSEACRHETRPVDSAPSAHGPGNTVKSTRSPEALSHPCRNPYHRLQPLHPPELSDGLIGNQTSGSPTSTPRRLRDSPAGAALPQQAASGSPVGGLDLYGLREHRGLGGHGGGGVEAESQEGSLEAAGEGGLNGRKMRKGLSAVGRDRQRER